MARNGAMEMHEEPSIDTDKLSYEIFSILESKFLFGYDDHNKLWIPKQIEPSKAVEDTEIQDSSAIKNQRGKICILSVDGGCGDGMRGILSGKALAYLEQAIKTKSGDPDARIADYFDVAAGTGIGGIFTAMLFATKDSRRPIFHADDTWRFVADHGKKLCRNSSRSGSGSGSGSGGGRLLKKILRGGGGGSSSSATAGLEKVMKEAFTEKSRFLTLKDTLKPVLIPCYDLSSSAPLLFSRADALESDSFDFRLWEVCRATSAEPGSSGPVLMQSVDGKTRCMAVDGGLAMSNPTAAAITHVLHNKQEFPFVRGVDDILVLSIGSGQLLEVNYEYEQVKGWKRKEWARPMARISGDGSADLVDHAVAMAFGHCRSTNYVRIQANGTTRSGHGNVETECRCSWGDNVKKLIGVGEEMLKQKNVESVMFGGKRIGEKSNAEKLDWLAGELVQEHQRRSCRIAPTVAFKQPPAAAATATSAPMRPTTTTTT